jgi:hypothetical protein
MSDGTDDRRVAPARKTDEEYLADLARQHAEGMPTETYSALTDPETKPPDGQFVPIGPDELVEALESMASEQAEPAPPPGEPEERIDAPAPAPVEAFDPRPAFRGRWAAPNPLLRLLLQVLAVAALIALAVALYLITW